MFVFLQIKYTKEEIYYEWVPLSDGKDQSYIESVSVLGLTEIPCVWCYLSKIQNLFMLGKEHVACFFSAAIKTIPLSF